jgi:hypothetical protein
MLSLWRHQQQNKKSKRADVSSDIDGKQNAPLKKRRRIVKEEEYPVKMEEETEDGLHQCKDEQEDCRKPQAVVKKEEEGEKEVKEEESEDDLQLDRDEPKDYKKPPAFVKKEEEDDVKLKEDVEDDLQLDRDEPEDSKKSPAVVKKEEEDETEEKDDVKDDLPLDKDEPKDSKKSPAAVKEEEKDDLDNPAGETPAAPTISEIFHQRKWARATVHLVELANMAMGWTETPKIEYTVCRFKGKSGWRATVLPHDSCGHSQTSKHGGTGGIVIRQKRAHRALKDGFIKAVDGFCWYKNKETALRAILFYVATVEGNPAEWATTIFRDVKKNGRQRIALAEEEFGMLFVNGGMPLGAVKRYKNALYFVVNGKEQVSCQVAFHLCDVNPEEYGSDSVPVPEVIDLDRVVSPVGIPMKEGKIIMAARERELVIATEIAAEAIERCHQSMILKKARKEEREERKEREQKDSII